MLYSFTGKAPDYAQNAVGGLVRDPKGNLYGTTSYGGVNSYLGNIFKLEPSGTMTDLYNFTKVGGDGEYPATNLTLDAHGNLYGTTNYGGDFECPYRSGLGCGMAFKVNATGSETILYVFAGGTNGFSPSSLVRDAQGNLYGTTIGGGDVGCEPPSGCGTVFRLSPPVTTTTLTASPNPSTYGQTITFTAVVTSGAGTPPDGETVSFMKGKTVLGTGTLSGGSASFTTSALPVSKNAVTAVYGGDSKFAGGTSKAVSQVVSKATTTTSLGSSQNPSVIGQSVTFTVSVTPEFSGTVKGTVTFYDGTTALRTLYLSGGVAKFATKTLDSGTHSITATYNGSTNFSGSSSAPLTQTVN